MFIFLSFAILFLFLCLSFSRPHFLPKKKTIRQLSIKTTAKWSFLFISSFPFFCSASTPLPYLPAFTEPLLYRLDSKSSKPVLVQHFPDRTSLLGIVQLNQHKIAVIAGNLTGSIYRTSSGVPGSFSVFLLSLRGRILTSFPVPGTSLLESITTLPKSPQYLLLSDPALAVVWRLNIRTGAVDKAITASDLVSEGKTRPELNSVHVLDDYLYFTDTSYPGIGRLRFTPDGRPSGDALEVEFLFPRAFYYFDDFAVRPDGSIYFTNPFENTVTYLSGINRPPPTDPLATTVDVAGLFNPDEGVEHPTAVAFSNNAPRCNFLYIVSAGFLPGFGDTGGGGGGQVLKLDLDVVGSVFDLTGYNTSCKA